jgi:hypothetical protein
MLLGIVIDTNFVDAKAYLPIVLTLVGISKDVNDMHRLNA